MRYVKRLGVALAAVCVLGAMVASMSNAAMTDPLFLLEKTAYIISGGAGTLSTLGNPFTLTCNGATGSGNTGGNDTETFSGTLTFTGCNANSLGAAAGTITYKYDGLLCWINETNLEVGAYILSTEAVHLENVPLVGLVTLASGSADVAAVSPTNTKTKTFTETLETSGTGDQKVTSCLDLGKSLTPKISVTTNEGSTVNDGAINTKLAITAEVEGQVDG